MQRIIASASILTVIAAVSVVSGCSSEVSEPGGAATTEAVASSTQAVGIGGAVPIAVPVQRATPYGLLRQNPVLQDCDSLSQCIKESGDEQCWADFKTLGCAIETSALSPYCQWACDKAVATLGEGYIAVCVDCLNGVTKIVEEVPGH